MSEFFRWLVIGDPHFKTSNIRDAREFRAKVVKLIKSLKTPPDAVVILGDLHDSFERIHSLVMAEICGLFEDILACLGEEWTKLFYVVGNHDAINNQIYLSNDHAFLPFKRWPMVVVDRPVIKNTEYGTFVLCPYVPPGRLKEALATMEYDFMKARAVFCHQEFRDVQLGPKPSKHGDVWPDNAPLAISGHIHEHQWLKDNILYVGEPFDSSYGSEGDKTVSIIDFYKDGQVNAKQQVDLGMPRRLTVTLTIEQLKAYQKPERTHVRVYVTGTTEELAVFKKSKEYKELSKDLKIITKPSDVLVARRNEGGLRYAEILAQSVEGESKAVKEAFAEVGIGALSS